ncbi:hypothetical protein BH10PSE7_BH10PSE7_03780 [soil metagenome]
MKMTAEGLGLIKRFEGFRAEAYRDPVGVWTVGYGHTPAAGAPDVHPGLIVSRGEADKILARDVAAFAQGVERLVKVQLSDAQFSALVSFAYNIGLANFARSSVLKAVNRQDFDAIPRALALWVKAGGKVLPGLVKRRAAEAQLFVGAAGVAETAAKPEVVKGKSAFGSSTNWAAVISAFAGFLTAFAAAYRDIADAAGGPWIAFAAFAVMLAASAWIMRERLRKSREEGV